MPRLRYEMESSEAERFMVNEGLSDYQESIKLEYGDLYNFLAEKKVLDLNTVEKFRDTKDSIQRLSLLSQMSLRNAIECIDTYGTDKGKNYLNKRLTRYQHLSKNNTEVSSGTIRIGLLRDIFHAAMIGTPELAVYDIAKKNINARGFSENHLPLIHGYHSGITQDEIGYTYPFLRKIYDRAYEKVNKKYNPDKYKSDEIEHKAVLIASDWLTSAMDYNDPRRSRFSTYSSNPEEMIAWAQLDSQTRKRFRSMRRKIEGINLTNIGRFIGRSGNYNFTPELIEDMGKLKQLREVKRKIDENIRKDNTDCYLPELNKINFCNIPEKLAEIRKDLGLNDSFYDKDYFSVYYEIEELIDNAIDEISNLPNIQKYEKKKNIALKAIDLQFVFNDTKSSNQFYPGVIDWINEAPFSTIKRIHNALRKGVSKESAMRLAIWELYGDKDKLGHKGLVLDKEIALRMIENNKTHNVANGLSYFSGLDNEVAMSLVDKGYVEEVLDNSSIFEGLILDKSAFLRFFKIQQYSVINNLKKFIGLDKESAELMFENYGQYVLDNPHLFKDLVLNKKFALDLVEIGYNNLVGNNISKFTGLSDKLKAFFCESASEIAKNEEISEISESETEIAAEILFARGIHGSNLSYFKPLQKLTKAKMNFLHPDKIIDLVNNSVINDPKFVLEGKEIFVDIFKNCGKNSEFESIWKTKPWLVAISKLQSIQAINNNEKNCPWVLELKPLLKTIFNEKFVSLDNPNDAELLFSFIKKMGMVNIPSVFKIYAECFRNNSLSELSNETINELNELGIKLKKPNGEWKFSDTKNVFAELNNYVNNFRKTLLSDSIPNGMETKIGIELFNKLKGSTSWERHDSVDEIISLWKKTLQSKDVKIPIEFQENVFNVGVISRVEKKQTRLEESEINKILDSKECLELYSPIANSVSVLWEYANPIEYWLNTKSKLIIALNQKINESENLLSKDPEELSRLIDSEPDNDKRKMLLAFTSSKARESKQKHLVTLKNDLGRLESLDLKQDLKNIDEKIIWILEELQKIDKKSFDVDAVFRRLSIQHMGLKMPEGWRERLKDNFQNSNQATRERIETLTELSRGYVSEHYLHDSQEINHTGHMPFSKDLNKKLRQVWKVQEDTQNLYPLERVLKKIVFHMEDSKINLEPDKETSVSMIPAVGLLKIYSGDFGDACYTSRHKEIANGDYKNIVAWIYAINRNKSTEKIIGSMLNIIATTEQGGDAIIARANNPKENFIQSVDSDKFVISSLREVIETAKKMRKEKIARNIAWNKSQCVLIPIDRATASCSNRGLVADVYKKRFTNCEKVGLLSTKETNFNSYDNWNKNSTHACVKIWEIDKNGKEIWYGVWT
jgi:hypothetical protein